jgi:hypothetical protein
MTLCGTLLIKVDTDLACDGLNIVNNNLNEHEINSLLFDSDITDMDEYVSTYNDITMHLEKTFKLLISKPMLPTPNVSTRHCCFIKEFVKSGEHEVTVVIHVLL